MTELPQGWVRTVFGDVLLSVIGGGTPSRNVAAYFEGNIPWFTVKDMKSLRPADAEEHISEEAIADSSANLIPAHTLVIATRIALGRAMRPTVACAINQDLKAIIPGSGVEVDFLLYWVIAHEEAIQELGSGTTVAGIRLETLRSLPMLLPPTAEQVRIVIKLEELLSDLDDGVTELKAARKKLEQYRLSLLNEAAEGVLTSNWREQNFPFETGAQLLARALSERRVRWERSQLATFKEQRKTPPSGWPKKYSAPAPPTSDGTNLASIPESWTWASVEQITSDERHSLAIGPFGSNLKAIDYRESGIPLVFVRNIRSGNYGGEYTKFITARKATELHAHSVRAGDVLVTKMGDPPGDADVYPAGQPEAIITADCIKIRCWEGLIRPHFLMSVINSRIGKQQIEPITQGVAQKKVSLGRFSTLAIPVPPYEEQKEIESVIAQTDREIDDQLVAVEVALKQAAAQRLRILGQAFSGKLIPQHADDEPASTLLKRIRAEQEEYEIRPKLRKPKSQKETVTVTQTLEKVLAEADDWLSAQEVFRRCGVTDGSQTDEVEVLYAELRALDKAGRLVVDVVANEQGTKQFDRLKLVKD